MNTDMFGELFGEDFADDLVKDILDNNDPELISELQDIYAEDEDVFPPKPDEEE